MTQFNKINQSVCFQCLQLQSVLISLASTHLVIRTHFFKGAFTGQDLVYCGMGGGWNRQLWNGVTVVGYGDGDGGGGILHIAQLSKCAVCMT